MSVTGRTIEVSSRPPNNCLGLEAAPPEEELAVRKAGLLAVALDAMDLYPQDQAWALVKHTALAG